MKISICKLEKRMDTILALAEVYQQSYNRLSERYKTAQEMSFYTIFESSFLLSWARGRKRVSRWF